MTAPTPGSPSADGGRGEEIPADRMPRDDEPGGADTPLATEGEGPVGLQDRVAPDEKGSPATNQGSAEPMPSTPGHRDPNAGGQAQGDLPPLEPPLLAEMNVGAGDPQRPSLGALTAPTTGAEPGPGDGPGNAPRDVSADGVAPFEERPAHLGRTATGVDTGPEVPAGGTTGESHRAPGLQGTPSPAERVETDVQDSAAAMVRETGRESGPGDSQGVPVPSERPSPGTSEESGVVQGARIPAGGSSDEPGQPAEQP